MMSSKPACGDESPSSPAPTAAVGEARAVVEPRILGAWREWLSALAVNADAALAAAQMYASLEPGARDALLDALREDEERLDVPRLAIYAPLLGVEDDPERVERMLAAIGDEAMGEAPGSTRALHGIAPDGSRVAVLVSPLYLSFVRTLWCRYAVDAGFRWVRQEALATAANAPRAGVVCEGVRLDDAPLTPVIDELAHAILAHRRSGEALPSGLAAFRDLFDASPEPHDAQRD